MKGTISANLADVLDDADSRRALKDLLKNSRDGKIESGGKTYAVTVRTNFVRSGMTGRSAERRKTR